MYILLGTHSFSTFEITGHHPLHVLLHTIPLKNLFCHSSLQKPTFIKIHPQCSAAIETELSQASSLGGVPRCHHHCSPCEFSVVQLHLTVWEQ